MILLSYILFAMLVLRFIVVFFNGLSRPFLPKARVAVKPKVSVLIPARNEEKNLPNLLSDLGKCNYSNFEVVVCNDQSTDKTEQILLGYAKKMSNLRFFTKNRLPMGWNGKTHACFELAQIATGDYLLFLDADVRLSPDSVTRAISFAQQKKLSLLSVFPGQIMQTQGEKLTVPIMNWILLSFLPLRLVRWSWFSSLSAANGQFMLFDAESYNLNQWHLKVKKSNVEDIEIARLMKCSKQKIAVLLGGNLIQCRMYTSYRQAVNGFSRNIHQYFGGSRLWLLFFVAMVWLRLPILLAAQQFLLAGVSVLLFLFMKIIVSLLSRQDIMENLKNTIGQMVSLIEIASRNGIKRKKVEWKGRVYQNM
jgi:glycosyltransferase involved in cell wall biosynthesis